MASKESTYGAAVGRMERREDARKGEAERVAKVKASGAVPHDVGPVPDAPARGTFGVQTTFALYPDGEDGFAKKPAGHRGRRTVFTSDTFDIAEAQAKRNKKPAPFSESQIAIGRAYRNLIERLESAGIQCSSLEVCSGGTGAPGEYIDALLRDRQRRDALNRRIGMGVSLHVRRPRPSKRGARINITDFQLVYCFCVRQMTFSQILKAHGWHVKGETTTALQKALAETFDRMNGPVRRGSSWSRFGHDQPDIWGIDWAKDAK